MLSVIELLKAYLDEQGELADVAVGGVRAGPADNIQQDAGVLVLADAGSAGKELWTNSTRRRISIRCLGPTIEHVGRLSRLVIDVCHKKNRITQRLPSDDKKYLIHWMEVNGGPSLHRDSEVTWEMLVFVELWVHTVAI